MTEKKRAPALTIAANIDRQTFMRFAVFDTLIRKKGWRNPALFALIMSAFALVCFLVRKTHGEALLLGSVLLGVGLVLPLTWLGMFFASVRRQAGRSGLSPDKAQYFVTLSPEKIHVEKEKESADFAWKDAYMAFRAKGCIYLYVAPTRAFLLPDGPDTENAWAIITAALAPGKIRVRAR